MAWAAYFPLPHFTAAAVSSLCLPFCGLRRVFLSGSVIRAELGTVLKNQRLFSSPGAPLEMEPLFLKHANFTGGHAGHYRA